MNTAKDERRMTSVEVYIPSRELSWSDPQHSSNMTFLAVIVWNYSPTFEVFSCNLGLSLSNEFILKQAEKNWKRVHTLELRRHKFLHEEKYMKMNVTLTNPHTSKHHKPFYHWKHIRLLRTFHTSQNFLSKCFAIYHYFFKNNITINFNYATILFILDCEYGAKNFQWKFCELWYIGITKLL